MRTHTCMQVGKPYELDAHTLDTLGEDDMDGQIGQRLAGHYSIVLEPDGTRRCVCFGTQVRRACACVHWGGGGGEEL